MTDFKPGDRVQYNAKDKMALREHMDLGIVKDSDGSDRIRVRWDNGDVSVHCLDYVVPVASGPEAETPEAHAYAQGFTKGWDAAARDVRHAALPPTRPLVGPAPKVEAPVFVAPFKADEDCVLDANNESVLTVDAPGVDYSVNQEFAAYVAAALNARVFGEE